MARIILLGICAAGLITLFYGLFCYAPSEGNKKEEKEKKDG